MIKITHNIRDVRGVLADSPTQVAFATAMALTKTAKDAEKAEQQEMRRVFDRPVPYTLRALRVVPATKDRLEASLFVKGYQDDFRGVPPDNYLFPQVFGGERRMKAFERALQRVGVLPEGWRAIPASGARLDAFGNMSAGHINQILAWFQAFGEQGYSSNLKAAGYKRLQRGNARKGVRGVEYFASRGRGVWTGGGSWRGGLKVQHLPRGIYARVGFGFGKALKPVLIFVRRTRYRPVWDFGGVAQKVVDARLQANFDAALATALRTARYSQQGSLL